jgi:hypothetical protein
MMVFNGCGGVVNVRREMDGGPNGRLEELMVAGKSWASRTTFFFCKKSVIRGWLAVSG